MARKIRIGLFELFVALSAALATAILPGNMVGSPIARFLNFAVGIAVLSMPLLVLAYVAHKAATSRLRFSLRVLLNAMSLVAVVLGLAVWAGR